MDLADGKRMLTIMLTACDRQTDGHTELPYQCRGLHLWRHAIGPTGEYILRHFTAVRPVQAVLSTACMYFEILSRKAAPPGECSNNYTATWRLMSAVPVWKGRTRLVDMSRLSSRVFVQVENVVVSARVALAVW